MNTRNPTFPSPPGRNAASRAQRAAARRPWAPKGQATVPAGPPPDLSAGNAGDIEYASWLQLIRRRLA